LDDKAIVVDLVDDPMVTGADSVSELVPGELLAAGRPGIVCEKVDGSTYALLVSSREGGQRLDSSAGDLDVVVPCHTNPRSALTSSQGT